MGPPIACISLALWPSPSIPYSCTQALVASTLGRVSRPLGPCSGSSSPTVSIFRSSNQETSAPHASRKGARCLSSSTDEQRTVRSEEHTSELQSRQYLVC